MPAVIQRSFTPEGATFATTQWAAREDDLFHGDSWKWIDGPECAEVFEDFEAAAQQALALRTPGVWVWAAVRAADDSKSQIADSPPAAAMSPSQMARGDTPARIAAARQNRRVTALRRTAEDFRRVYEETCKRLGERDGDE